MKNLDKIATDLDKVFRTISVVLDSTLISFDPIDTVIAQFREVLNICEHIDLNSLKNDLLAGTKSESEITEILDLQFEDILKWKPGINTIMAVKESQGIEIHNYFRKLSHLEINYTNSQKEMLAAIYKAIGLRLLMFKIEIKKLKDLYQSLDDIKEKMNKMHRSTARDYNLGVVPDKTESFVMNMIKMYRSNFFVPADQKEYCSEENLIQALEAFFDLDITDASWYKSVMLVQPYSSDESVAGSIIDYKDPATAEQRQPTNNAITQPAANDGDLFAAYILHHKRMLLAREIKVVFHSEKGKSIRLLLLAMENHTPPLISIGNRNFKAIFNALKVSMGRDIGSYQSVVGYKYDELYDKPDYDSINVKLLHILKDL